MEGENEQGCCYEESHGRCFGLAAVAMVIVGAGAYLIGDVHRAESSPERVWQLRVTKANGDAQAENARANVANQKRIADIQLAVVKACGDRGGYPLLINGNVDCRVVK